VSGIDHVVHAVADIERAAAFYETLGFTLTPEGHHPWGTSNRLVLIGDAFIELLTVTEPDLIPEPSEGFFSFGAFNQRFLHGGDGVSMLALKSSDAEADLARFRRVGLRTFEPFHFGRTATLPDGTEARVAFSLAFTEQPGVHRAGFFTCQHHRPDLVWRPEYLQHRNGATRLAEVLLTTAPEARGFLEAFTGSTMVETDGESERIPMTGAQLTLAAEWEHRFPGVPTDQPVEPITITGFRVSVPDLDVLEVDLGAAGVAHARGGDWLAIGTGAAMGAVIEFSETRPDG
jgi:catechol 2,3-dioxygenase-like lactoylglutathione lyase family enzyme